MKAFQSAMRDAGLEFSGPLICDGGLHRFKCRGDHAANSWYILHPDKPVAGAFGCWKRGISRKWSERKENEYTPEALAKLRARWKELDAQRKEEEEKLHASARAEAEKIASHAKPVESHEYLLEKGVKPHGEIKAKDDLLVLPLRDIDGVLHTVQTINTSGGKKFLYGGRIKGCFFTVAKNHGPIVICEGYATGASIFECTGFYVIAAMNCGNLLAVANAVRKKWDSREIIIAADNDSATEGNPGVVKAWRAAQDIGAHLAVPLFKPDSDGTDFNDLHQSEGAEQVKAQILSALRSSDNRGAGEDKLPPNSPESERGIIGCCLADPKTCVPMVIEKFKDVSDVFYDSWCASVMESVIHMWEERKKVDVITLTQTMRDHGFDKELEGEWSLAKLRVMASSTENLSEYLDIVERKRVLRRAIKFCGTFKQLAFEANGNSESIIDEFEQQAMAVRGLKKQSCPPIEILVEKAMDDIDRDFKTHGKRDGAIATGISDLDKMFVNFEPAELIVIAGYPGSGKTALAANIAEYNAVDLNIPVGFFSLEMLARSVTRRIICSRSRVNWKDAKDGKLTDKDFKEMIKASAQIRKAPLYFDDASGISILELRAKARRMAQEHQIKLAVVDYLQLLTAISKDRKFESRQQEVSDISRGLKDMAKELAIPVVVLSQLNDDGRLRESRSIGQDADDVIILKVKDEEAKKEIRQVNADVTKQRNGPTGDVPLVFFSQYTRFESRAFTKQDFQIKTKGKSNENDD